MFDAGDVDPQERKVYLLIGGFRRFHAFQQAARKNMDRSRISEDMEVDAVEVVRGEGQDDLSFDQDLVVRSVAENEVRRNFSTEERLEIVKLFRKKLISDSRAAAALGVSDTQLGRFVEIVSHPWLHDYVVANAIGVTDAATLIEAAKKNNCVDEFEEDFTQWVTEQEAKIATEREALEKINKKMTPAAEQVKRFITRGLVQHWLHCMAKGRHFDDEVQFRFGIHLDAEKRTLTVPAAKLELDKMSSQELELMISELQEASARILPEAKKRRAMEAAADLTDEESEAELNRIRQQGRLRQQQKAQADSGRPAKDFDQVEEPKPLDVVVEDEDGNQEPEQDDLAAKEPSGEELAGEESAATGEAEEGAEATE